MAIRSDKSDRTSYMKKYDINGVTIENDPLLSTGKSFSSVLNQYILYTITNYDRIDLLSYRFYNTPNYWWLILLANDMVSETEFVAGLEIKIPSLGDYQAFLDTFQL